MQQNWVFLSVCVRQAIRSGLWCFSLLYHLFYCSPRWFSGAQVFERKCWAADLWTLNMSSSTVHSIIKRFWEYRELSSTPINIGRLWFFVIEYLNTYQHNGKPNTAAITIQWVCRKYIFVAELSSPNLSPVESIWHIMKWKIQQRHLTLDVRGLNKSDRF